MSIESDADRLAVLQALGELVSIEGRQVWGIFERQYTEIPFDSPVEGLRPTLQVRDIDIDGVSRGAPVNRKGKTYSVTNFEPDGEGMTILGLSE